MNKVIEFLEKNNIEYILHEHPAVFTCEEAEKYCTNVPGIAWKNLLLRNKKGKRNFLVVLPAKKQVDLKKFTKLVEESKISFGSNERLKKFLWLEPWSVSPFGLINDINKIVEVYIDRDIYESEIVNFHPNVNTASLELSKDMFRKFLNVIEHEINVI